MRLVIALCCGNQRGLLRGFSEQDLIDFVGENVDVLEIVGDAVKLRYIFSAKKVDLVTLCRPLIADPELSLKTMEGRFDDIRMCVACNQKCLDNLSGRPPKAVGCWGKT
jgi:2,4-dienoyl-CoA reductase-like NADH-dependent reductase (Old Yellow Enzyme family)